MLALDSRLGPKESLVFGVRNLKNHHLGTLPNFTTLPFSLCQEEVP